MLTNLMRDRIEDLVLNFTRLEMVELTTFLKMANEVRGMEDNTLKGLSMVLEDKGNPNAWNLVKLVRRELANREARMAGFRKATGDDLPTYQEAFGGDKTGTMVPHDADMDSRLSELYRRTRPQPGDE